MPAESLAGARPLQAAGIPAIPPFKELLTISASYLFTEALTLGHDHLLFLFAPV